MSLPHYRKLPCADERQDGKVENCVAASCVNICRAATNGTIPASDAEVVALRLATGDTSGGETLAAGQHGIVIRYGFHDTELTNGWPLIVNGLAALRWFAVRGMYASLPERLRNAGQGNVSHVVAVGPAEPGFAVIVDSLQKPVPVYERVTLAELRVYCATGDFEALGIDEYSHYTPPPPVTHWQVKAGPGLYRVYTLKAGKWSRSLPRLNGKGPFRCTPPPAKPTPNVCGAARVMVQVKEGPWNGLWLSIANPIVKATEVPGA